LDIDCQNIPPSSELIDTINARSSLNKYYCIYNFRFIIPPIQCNMNFRYRIKLKQVDIIWQKYSF
jgi:hypothetical protein